MYIVQLVKKLNLYLNYINVYTLLNFFRLSSLTRYTQLKQKYV